MSALDFTIRTQGDMVQAVDRLGFLPFFANVIPRFSIEELVDRRVWFAEDDGPWEWKGPVIREAGCAYGKFFEGRAAFISGEWFPDFANYRRDGYDFDARYEEGIAPYRENELYRLVEANGPLTSRRLKQIGGYGKEGKKGFDALITRLQAQAYVVISDFVYATNRAGERYGWGIAEYATPEQVFGPEFAARAYEREPEESFARMVSHLTRLLPRAGEAAIRKFLQ